MVDVDLGPEKRERLVAGFAEVINVRSAENQSNTPDFVIAEYRGRCLETWNWASRRRDQWWGYEQNIFDG